MKEPDFSGIDPLRVPEARRRVTALNEYLALPDPTTADAKSISAGIGLSHWQFMRLARVWREHRKPNMLVVGRLGPAKRSYNIDPRGVAIAKEVIARAGNAAELATAAVLIETQCARKGIVPPSRPTIWNYIRKVRAAGLQQLDGPPRVVVGRMWFHLPIALTPASPSATNMPVALIAVALPERRIISHVISLHDEAPPNVGEFMAELLTTWTPGKEQRHLLIERADRSVAATALISGGLGNLRPFNRSIQRELSRAFGGMLGNLKAIYRRGLARPKTKRVVQRQDERISPEAAIRAIEEAIGSHNEAIGQGVGPFDILEPPPNCLRS